MRLKIVLVVVLVLGLENPPKPEDEDDDENEARASLYPLLITPCAVQAELRLFRGKAALIGHPSPAISLQFARMAGVPKGLNALSLNRLGF